MYPYNVRREERKIQRKEQIEQSKINAAQMNENTNRADAVEEAEPETLMMIESGMRRVAEDADIYNMMATRNDDTEKKELLLKMYLNKCKAGKMLSEINSDLTGERLVTPKIENISIDDDMEENYKNMMFKEIDGIAFFRSLLFTFLNVGYRDMMYEIITDMQSNAQVLGILYDEDNR